MQRENRWNFQVPIGLGGWTSRNDVRLLVEFTDFRLLKKTFHTLYQKVLPKGIPENSQFSSYPTIITINVWHWHIFLPTSAWKTNKNMLQKASLWMASFWDPPNSQQFTSKSSFVYPLAWTPHGSNQKVPSTFRKLLVGVESWYDLTQKKPMKKTQKTESLRQVCGTLNHPPNHLETPQIFRWICAPGGGFPWSSHPCT